MRPILVLGGVAIGAAVVAGGYELIKPNSYFDKVRALSSCNPDNRPNPIPKVVKIQGGNGTIDRTFTELRNGDSIKFGNLELKAVDSRTQELYFTENKAGSETMANLGCPGYIKLDIYHKGKIVAGGSGVEIVYAKFAGGMLDGWPNFTLRDVLGYTKMAEQEISNILQESTQIEFDKMNKEYDARVKRDEVRAQIIAAHERVVALNPKLKAKVKKCKQDFFGDGGLFKDDGLFNYRVKGDDSKRGKVGFAQKFYECNGIEAFFPDSYTVDRYSAGNVHHFTDRGRGVEFSPDKPVKVGERVAVIPSSRKDLIEASISKR